MSLYVYVDILIVYGLFCLYFDRTACDRKVQDGGTLSWESNLG